MTGVVLLCSGQGNQDPEMFDLVASEPAAAPVFASASRALGGRDPRDLVRQGIDIHRNDVAQVLCCTQALAVWAVLGPSAPRPLTIAGYSAGELPSWAVAGVVGLETAFDLVTRRVELMDAETREASCLAAVVGLPRHTVDELCGAHGLDVAIVNGPVHFIIGGRVAAVETALGEAARRGASRAVRLPIHVAAHTPALRRASEAFGETLHERVGTGTYVPRGVRLISGIDGAPVREIRAGMDKLAAQISTTIDWAACMDACRSAGPARALELGPGDALARMMTEAASGMPARSTASFRTLEGVRRWIEAAP